LVDRFEIWVNDHGAVVTFDAHAGDAVPDTLLLEEGTGLMAMLAGAAPFASFSEPLSPEMAAVLAAVPAVMAMFTVPPDGRLRGAMVKVAGVPQGAVGRLLRGLPG